MKLSQVLEMWLSVGVIGRQSQLRRIPFASPVLQGRAGYREVFQAWLRFKLGAKITWAEGGEVYEFGQRNVATLYEYWCYFRLLEVFGVVFEVNRETLADLFETDNESIGLRLKTGRNVSVHGTSEIGGVVIGARLDFNRTFAYSSDGKRASSWTRPMRPDCTISVWRGADEKTAESIGALTHMHFDSKYRVDSLSTLFGPECTAEDDNEFAVFRNVKRDDLLKMHAYKDAIRRSGGAYVLYPGELDQSWRQYHEILPGIGAFVLRPGIDNPLLAKFIKDVATQVAGGYKPS